MPNKYVKEQITIYDKMDEEDREVENDLYRAKTEYYKTLTRINSKILSVLDSMDDAEIKDIITNNGVRIPVKRI